MTISIRSFAAAGIAFAAVALSATNAGATDPRVINYGKHYVECKIWLLTDWAKHVRYCTPSHVVPEFKSLAPTSGGNPPVVYIPPVDLPPDLPPAA